jgi:hypothetical protein
LFLALGFVEVVGAAPAPDAPPAPEPVEVVPVANGGFVDECLADLARLDVPLDSGRPTCAKVLRDNGISYGNEVLAAVVKIRRQRAALSAGTTS